MSEFEASSVDPARRLKVMVACGRPALLAATLTLSAVGLGSAALMAYRSAWEGRALLVAEPTQDVGRLGPNDTKIIKYKIINNGREVVMVVGSQVSCTCAVLKNPLPYSIPGGGEGILELMVRAPRKPGAFRLSLEVFTDSPVQPRLRLFTKGEVKGT